MYDNALKGCHEAAFFGIVPPLVWGLMAIRAGWLTFMGFSKTLHCTEDCPMQHEQRAWRGGSGIYGDISSGSNGVPV